MFNKVNQKIEANVAPTKCNFCPHSLNIMGKITCPSDSCQLSSKQIETMFKIVYGKENV